MRRVIGIGQAVTHDEIGSDRNFLSDRFREKGCRPRGPLMRIIYVGPFVDRWSPFGNEELDVAASQRFQLSLDRVGYQLERRERRGAFGRNINVVRAVIVE